MVQYEGASRVMVGSYRKRLLAVAGDRVNAGADRPLETGAGLKRDRVQVYEVPEVEGSQECVIACIIGAWGPSVRLPSCRVGVGHHQIGRPVHHAVTSRQMSAHHLTYGSQPMRMRRPTADRRSLSENTARFTSSRAMSAMRAARRDSCWLPSPRGFYEQSKTQFRHIVVPRCFHKLRRHKLPTPHLALWPTEVHVVMRGKVCEKGCYFLGIQTPLVATCKNKVCISNICHYLHFWKHTDFQNKDIQSPKYSVVLHLDHCIPVWGGGGCLFFSPLFSSLITEPPYTPQMREPQTYLSLKHTEKLSQSMYLYFLF